MGTQFSLQKGAQQPPPHFSAHVCCGQTVAHLSSCWALVFLCASMQFVLHKSSISTNCISVCIIAVQFRFAVVQLCFYLWLPYVIGQTIYIFILSFAMIALWNRADHYIFALWFLSFYLFLSSPNLSGSRLDVYHTSTHDVALVRI